jgi:hypothetical protein
MNVLRKTIFFIAVLFIMLGISHSVIVGAATKLSNGSTIANVPLQGLTYEEVRDKLQKEIEQWYSGEELIAEGDYERRTIPRNAFQFDIEDSVDNFKKQTKRNPFLFFLKSKEAHLPITVSIEQGNGFFNDWPEHIDVDKTLAKALTIASTLDDHTIVIEYKDDVPYEQEIISEVEQEIPELSQAVLKRAVEEINDQTISYRSPFSFLENVIIPDNLIDSTEELNFVSTALYELVLHTNIEITERHSQGKIPRYSKAGVDVAVGLEDDKDFIVYNPNDYSYTIKAEIKKDKLLMSLLSLRPQTTYKYELDHEQEIEQRTIYRYSRQLKDGEQEVISEGEKGLQVDVFRKNEDDSEDRVLISHEFYPPSPRIVLISAVSEQAAENNVNEIDAEFEDEENSYIDNEAYSNVRYIENEMEEKLVDLILSYLLKDMFGSDLVDHEAANDSVFQCLQVENSEEEKSDFSQIDLMYKCLQEKTINEESASDLSFEELNEQ